jgi:DNA invertase Pin-like site-specific DNA recombinase
MFQINTSYYYIYVLYVREGDTLLVHSMDRLARNLDDLRKIVKELTGRGVKVQFIKENMTFANDDTPIATLFLSVMGAFAEFERAIIRERQMEGIAIAKTKEFSRVGNVLLPISRLLR